MTDRPTRALRTARQRLAAAITIPVLIAGACGGDDDTAPAASEPEAAAEAISAGGIRVVSPAEAAAIQDAPPDDLVVLDVRTPQEFQEGHLEDATMIDFYRDDFRSQLESLDKDATYLLYCRSGNRSGQTRALMQELGFTDVADVSGGILAWVDAGLPVVSP